MSACTVWLLIVLCHYSSAFALGPLQLPCRRQCVSLVSVKSVAVLSKPRRSRRTLSDTDTGTDADADADADIALVLEATSSTKTKKKTKAPPLWASSLPAADAAAEDNVNHLDLAAETTREAAALLITPLPLSDSSSECAFAVCVHGEPTPLSRHMLSRGHMYNPSATQQRNFARACAQYLPRPPLEGPLEAELLFYFSRPMNHYRTGKFAGILRDEHKQAGSWHSKRKDLDNLIKFVLDSLNGLAYLDDSQISSIVSSKRYAEEGSGARTEVRIRRLLPN